MAYRLLGTVNVALLAALLQFAVAFAIAWRHGRYCREVLDPLAAQIVADADRGVRSAARRHATAGPGAAPARNRRPGAAPSGAVRNGAAAAAWPGPASTAETGRHGAARPAIPPVRAPWPGDGAGPVRPGAAQGAAERTIRPGAEGSR